VNEKLEGMIGEGKEDHDRYRGGPSGLSFAESLGECTVKAGSHASKNKLCFHGCKRGGKTCSNVGREKQTGPN